MAQFRTAVGFRRVFQLLVQSKLPLVGHNLFYDLLFTFNHFVTLALGSLLGINGPHSLALQHTVQPTRTRCIGVIYLSHTYRWLLLFFPSFFSRTPGPIFLRT